MAGGAADAAAAAAAPPPEQQQKTSCKCNGGRCHACGALCKRCACTCPDKPRKRAARGRPPKNETSNRAGATAGNTRRSSSRNRTQAKSGGGGGGGGTPKRRALGKLSKNSKGSSPATKALSGMFGVSRSRRRPLTPPDADADDEDDCKGCLRRNYPDRYLALYAEEEEREKESRRGSDRGTTPGVKIQSVGDAIEAFAISDTDAKKLPSVAERFGKESLKTTNSKGAERTANLVVKACENVIEVFVGGASKDDMTGDVATKLLGRSEQKPEADGRFVDVAKATMAVYGNSPRNSVEKRVAGAILAKSIRPKDLKDAGLDGVSKKIRQKGVDDFKRIVEEGKRLVVTKHSRQKIKDDVIEKGVEIMLQPKFVGTLSWGVKDVVLDEVEVYGLPRLTRKCAREAIYKEYQQQTNDDEETIGRSTFLQILGVLTSSEERILSSVDYVTGRLINDTCEVLQDITDKVSSGESRAKLTDYIAATKNFLKVQYDGHTEKEDGDAFHGLIHALNKKEARPSASRQCNCNACKLPFFVCAELTKAVAHHRATGGDARLDAECYDDALKVITDVRNKFRLYMAHRCRVVNQQRAIATEEEDMIKQCERFGRSRILVTIDWKMKFNQCSGRETTTEHYGKRGMSWHGVMAVYYVMEKVKKTSDDGSEVEVEEPVRKSFYIDQIVEGENKQNAAAVLSALEAALVAIHCSISRSGDDGELQVTLLSDNAGCYQSKDLILLIQALNIRLAGLVFVRRLLHTETQDGKSFLDAHFGRATVHLKRFMKSARRNRVRRILTPEGLAAALAWDGGINNSVVQRIAFDKDKLAKLTEEIKMVVAKSSDYFSRVNDVWYERPENPTGDILKVETIAQIKFDIRVQAFTGIGREVGFSADVQKGEFEPDAQGKEEIRRKLLGLDLVDGDDDGEEEDDNGDGASDRSQPPGRPLDYDFSRPRRRINTRDGGSGNGEGRNANDGSNTGDGSADDDDDDDDDEEYEEGSVASSDSEGTWEEIEDDINDEAFAAEAYRAYGPSENPMYSADSAVTGVSVSKSTAMGEYATAKRRKKKVAGQVSTVLLEARPNQRKDGVALAVRAAVHRINGSAFSILDGKDVSPLYDHAKDFALDASELTVQSWARREGRSGMYGATYLEAYRPLIQEFYLVGKRNSSEKMSPSIMREKLKDRYPNRFSLPGETEIRAMISALIQADNKKPSTRTREAAVPDYITEIVSDLITPPKGDPNAMPAKLYEDIHRIVNEKFGNIPDDFPEKSKIKSKISSMKSAAKKKAKSAAVN